MDPTADNYTKGTEYKGDWNSCGSQSYYYPFHTFMSEQYLPVRPCRDSYPESYKMQTFEVLEKIYQNHADKGIWNWDDGTFKDD